MESDPLSDETPKKLRCRVCLGHTDDAICLLRVSNSRRETVSYIDILSSVCKLQSEKAPLNICHSCARAAEISYDFKVLCEQSDRVLRDENVPLSIEDADKPTTETHCPENLIYSNEGDAESLDIKPKIINDSSVNASLQNASNSTGGVQPQKCILLCVVQKNPPQTTVKKPENAELNCYRCNKSFFRPGYLMRHMLSCNGKNDLACPMCKYKFTRKSSLKKHMVKCVGYSEDTDGAEGVETEIAEVNEEDSDGNLADVKVEFEEDSITFHGDVKLEPERYGCDEEFESTPVDLSEEGDSKSGGVESSSCCENCGCKFAFPWNLKRHALKCTAKPYSSCDFCDYKPVSLKDHYEHSKTHPDSYGRNCVYCDLHILKLDEYKKHLTEVHQDKKLGCGYCGVDIFLMPDLKKHLELRHPGERIRCGFCDFSTDTWILYTEHLKGQHDGFFSEKKCNWCDFKTVDQRNLTKHMEDFHGDKKTIECKLCGSKFIWLNSLKRHMKTFHQEKRRFGCEICGRIIGLGHLKLHMATEHPSYKSKKIVKTCENCKQTFTRLSSYRKHVNSKSCLVKKFPKACQVCGYKPESFRDYQAHKKSEHSERTSQICIYCEHVYVCSNGYRKHIILNHPEKQINCKYCTYVVYTPRAYINHMKSKHPAEKFECHLCDFTTDVTTIIYTHYLEGHQDYFKARRCKYCDFETICPTVMGKHLETTHDDKKTLQCDVCDKKFFNVTMKLAHMKTQHGEQVTPIICEICGKHLKCEYNLEQHMYIHKSERKFKCNLCPKTFKTKASLYGHSTSHSEERKHKCPECGQLFKTSSHMRSHVKNVHEKRKPHACTVCGLRFASRSYMNKHEAVHTGVRDYKCDECGKLFVRKEHLKQHSVVHTGERKHVCEVCGKGFTQAHVLRSHLKTHDT